MTVSPDPNACVQTRLIVLNQSVGAPFLDWLGRLAVASGPIELWSGNAPDVIGPGVTVHRLAPYDNRNVTRRLITWTRFTIAATWRLLRRGDRTPIFVVTNPPLMPLAARWLRTWQGRPYGLLEWDIYPQIMDAAGLVGRHNLVYRLWRHNHAGALRGADLIVTLGDHMAAVLRRTADDAALPVEVIPYWVDTDWLAPLPYVSNSFAQEHGLQDKLVVLYSGNLGATHAIETIVETARLLADEPRICMLIIGEGSKRSLVESAVADGRALTLRLLPLQPAAHLPQTLSSGHIGIVTLSTGYEGLSMPSKTYSLMAAGNAILGISRPPNDVAATVARHACGANFRPDEPQAIADWVRSLLADPEELTRLRTRARQAAIAHYSTAHCTARLNQAVASALLGENAGGRA
jgi:glycosyltransferase involved in cell wall biosynthesis